MNQEARRYFPLSTEGSIETIQDDTPAVSATEYDKQLQELCHVKAEEFQLLGYDEVSATEVWQCVQKRWKQAPALHAAVADILSLKVGQLMNYLTVSAYKGEFPEEDV